MATQKDFSTYRVLIVDDHELSRKLLLRQIEAFGISQAETACNGEDALQKLYDEKNTYDIVFLDWAMPVMNGFDLLKNLRRDQRFKQTALVMLSAEAQPDKIMEAIEAGVTSYLTKPVMHEDLESALRKIDDWLIKHN